MERTQVFLRKDQRAQLRAIAKRKGVAQSDLIRRGVDKVIEEEAPKDDWRDAVRAVAGMWADRDDLDEMMEHNRRLLRERDRRLYPHLYADDG